MQLLESGEMYLETILILTLRDHNVRSIDVAKYMNFSKPSVSRAMGRLKEQEYVTAATVLGASSSRIIRRHLLPNCVGQLIIQTCLQIPSAIFLESFLSYLGLGVSAPMASLGSLCSDAKETFLLFPYRLLFPAVLLSLIVLSLNLVGDGLRDALDPRLKS